MKFTEIMKHMGHQIDCTYEYFTGEVESVDNSISAIIYCHTCDKDIVCIDNPAYYTDGILNYPHNPCGRIK